MRWFKLKDDIIFDPQIQSMTEAERWVWIVFLSFASRERNGGFLCKGIDENYIKRTTNVQGEVLKSAIKKLINFGMLKIVKDRYYISNWKKYQSEYERVQKYRKSTKNVQKRYGKEVDIEVEVDKIRKEKILEDKSSKEGSFPLKEKKEKKVIKSSPRPRSEKQQVIARLIELFLKEKEWEYEKELYPRWAKAVSTLLKIMKTEENVKNLILWSSNRGAEKNLEWTLETCIKWVAEYKSYLKSQKEIERLRKEFKNDRKSFTGVRPE